MEFYADPCCGTETAAVEPVDVPVETYEPAAPAPVAPAPVQTFEPAPAQSLAPAPVQTFEPAPAQSLAPPVQTFEPAPAQSPVPAPVQTSMTLGGTGGSDFTIVDPSGAPVDRAALYPESMTFGGASLGTIGGSPALDGVATIGGGGIGGGGMEGITITDANGTPVDPAVFDVPPGPFTETVRLWTQAGMAGSNIAWLQDTPDNDRDGFHDGIDANSRNRFVW